MTITIELAAQTAFTFKSDVPSSDRPSHKSGILHCLKRTKLNKCTNKEDRVVREEHAFVWLDDVTASTRRGGAGGGVAAVVAEMERYGFDGGGMMFLPYSTRENWIRRYPHACPYIACNSIGRIYGVTPSGDFPFSRDQTSSSNKKRKRNPSNNDINNAPPSPKLFPSANLTDPERSQLHIQIHDYFSWLNSHLKELETAEYGRNKCRRFGLSVPGIQNILTKLEGCFRDVGNYKKEKERQEQEELVKHDSQSNDADNNNLQNNNLGDAPTASINNDNEKENNHNKTPVLEESLKFDLSQIVEEIHYNKLEEEARKNPPPAGGSSSSSKPALSGSHVLIGDKDSTPATVRKEFNFLFSRLVAYRERKGNTAVPMKYRDDDGVPLGRWAGDVRASKRALKNTIGADGAGLEYEPERKRLPQFDLVHLPIKDDGGGLGLTLSFIDPSSTATATTDATDTSHHRPGATITAMNPFCPFKDRIEVGDKLVRIDGFEVLAPEDFERNKEEEVRVFTFERNTPFHNTHLSKERVERLDSINFEWDVQPEVKSWDERFDILKQYMAEHDGRIPSKWEKWNSVGNWVHNQRRQWSKKDKKFMKERAPKLDAIGFPWVMRKGIRDCFTWEDNFQRFVEFGRVNRHFNVTRPKNVSGENEKENSEYKDALRFYSWVTKLKFDYRKYKSGKESSLTEDRINNILELGFEFDPIEPSNQKLGGNVPDLPFETRLEQVQSFQKQHGHLNVDFRYKKRNNFGRWAAQMSLRYKDWQEGKVEESPLMQHQFNQLRELGFAFNVFAEERTRRSWDENFEVFLKFQEEHGHSNVPSKHVSDRRMGTWVRLQRIEYRLLVEGKKSKLTQENYAKLESAGFEWESSHTKQKRSRELEE